MRCSILEIKPYHIDTSGTSLKIGGEKLIERSAWILVKFAQNLEKWVSFSLDDIRSFCGKEKLGEFSFNGLCDLSCQGTPMIRKEGDRFYFTHKFKASCYLHSPRVCSAIFVTFKKEYEARKATAQRWVQITLKPGFYQFVQDVSPRQARLHFKEKVFSFFDSDGKCVATTQFSWLEENSKNPDIIIEQY